MKFIHTADWQIGMKAVHLGDKGESVRRARFESARRVIDVANTRRVDFVLLAGDTFEHPGIARAKVRETANLLSGARCDVFVIPGNHDPAMTGAVWEDDCWPKFRNVHILQKAEPVAIPGGTLFPCPAVGKSSAYDPTDWIASAPSGGIRLGLAHGAIVGHPEMKPEFPIARDAAERLRLDYLALGHYHSSAIYECACGATRMAYSGTHEPTAFQERDSGNILLVEIARPGAAPVIEKIPTRALEWRTLDRRLDSSAAVAALNSELESITDPENTLIDCVLSGEVADPIEEAIQRIEELVTSRFLYGRFNRDRLLTGGGHQWIEELPEGYLRKTAQRLSAESHSTHDSAATALREFRRLWNEVRA
jgi:DNA repair exonuclease SbcCD nuclease subunit